jgi:ABC-type Zn uptake system ZnuABC Zn-binding protein ZnuA
LTLAALVVAGLSASGCGAAAKPRGVAPIAELEPASLAAEEPLRVVVTTSILADVVGRVGGDDIELSTLLPLGSEPHSFEPAPQDRRALEEAHVVLMNGLGLEPFLESRALLAEIPAPVVVLSEGIVPLAAEEGEGSGTADPHVWMDPANVIRWADNAAEVFAALDPARAGVYRERAEAFRIELESLDTRLVGLVEQVPVDRRKLVSDHDTLRYFAEHFGFEIVGAILPSPSSSAEASAQALAELEDVIRTEGVPAIFLSEAVSRDLAERVAEDTEVELVQLYVESLTGNEGPAPSYVALMDYNVHAIVEALREFLPN